MKISLSDYHKLKSASLNELAFETMLRWCGPGIPRPVREHRFHSIKKWRFDFSWPDRMIAVEIDGGTQLIRGGRHNTDKDRKKINAAISMGWRVIRFSDSQIKNDPEGCMDIVRSVFEKKEVKEI